MTNIAQLGFEIDSSQLVQAGQAADKAAAQIGRVGDTADKAGKQASSAGRQIGMQMGGGLGTAGKGADTASGQLGKVGGAMQAVGKAGKVAAAEIGNLSQSFGIATGSGGGVALNGVLRAATGGIQGLTSAMGVIGMTAGAVTAGIGTIAAALVGVQAALASVQDKWAAYEGQIKNTLGSSAAAKSAIAELYATAQGTGISFDTTTQSFNRLARNANDLGASNAEILKLSTTVQQLGVISGASAGEIGSGMLQLSQALASGKLNGDELRSIMEQMPALAKAIADGLGVSVGQLRAMGAAGELTGDKVFRSILGNADKVNAQFKDMPDTTERAFQRVSDSWSLMLSKMGEAANSSGFIQSILNATNGLIKTMAGAPSTTTKEADQLAGLQATRQNLLKLPGADRENSDTWRRLQTIEAQIRALQPTVDNQRAEQAAARDAENYRPAIANFGRGATAAKDAKTLAADQNELAEQISTIESALITAGRRGTPSVLPADQQPSTKIVEQMESSLRSLKQKLEDTADALSKLKRGTDDYRDALRMGGTGGGLDIAQKAIDTAKQLRSQGIKAAPKDTIGAVIDDRVARSGEDIAAIGRQADAQRKLVDTVGATRAAVRDAEIAQEAYDYRIKNFGTITTPAVEKAVASYTAALRSNKDAADALGDARAFQGIADQIDVLQAGAKAAADGAYAMRQAEAAARAAQANRSTPGLGDRQMEVFGAQEASSAQQQIDQITRQTQATLRQAGAARPGDARGIDLQQRIEDAQRGVAPDARGKLATAMRKQDEAEIAKLLNDQRLDIDAQVESQQQQLGLVHLQHADLAEQQAILAKTNELRRQGVDVQEDSRAVEVIAAAGRAARASVEADNTRSLVEQARTIEDQIGYQQQQLGLTKLYGEELAVQQAVLAKRAELIKQGIDPNSAGAQKVLDLTAAQARGGYQLDEQQRQADAWRSIWDGAASGATGSITAAFMAVYDKTQTASEAFRKSLSRTFSNMAEDIMNQALNPLKDALAALLKSGGSWLAGAFGVSGTGTAAGAGDAAGLGTAAAAKGAWFGDGGADFAFANGAAFTNRIVSSPTTFKFASGGAMKKGLMGEAGPEAIMPLRRGPDGRLGVSAAIGGGGGGNAYSISISVDASSGQAQSKSSGDDADNRGRALGEQLSRAVRDELLQQMRPGGILAQQKR